jgi:hypothetical protein
VDAPQHRGENMLSTKKKKKKIGVLGKLQKIVKAFDKYSRQAQLALAAELSGTNIAFYYSDVEGDIRPLFKLLSRVFKEDQQDDMSLVFSHVWLQNLERVRSSSFTAAMDNYPLHFTVAVNHTIEKPEQMFDSPWPTDVPTAVVGLEKTKEILSAKIEDIVFPKELLNKMFDVINGFISECEGDFKITKVHSIESMIKTVAYLNGHKEVELSDLYCMSGLWDNIALAKQYEAIVDSVISGYSSLADSIQVEMDELLKRARSAKSALNMGQAINYLDDSISSNATMATVATEALGSLTVLKQKVEDAAEGKNKTSKYTKPLFDLLRNINDSLSELRQMVGVR